MAGMVAIETSATALAMALGDMHGREIPYATQQALNEVAFKTQRAQKSEMAQVFELRNRFSQSGVQVNKADKADWPDMQAEVGIEERRSYLIDHILGGQRQGGRHGRAVLADTAMRSRSGRVSAGKRPAAMIAKAKRAQREAELRHAFGVKRRDKRLPFLFYSRKWGNEVLAQRMGSDRYPLRIIYAFRRGVTIRREFEFEKVAADEVGATYYQAFNKALRRAIASGKDKAERAASHSRDQYMPRGR